MKFLLQTKNGAKILLQRIEEKNVDEIVRKEKKIQEKMWKNEFLLHPYIVVKDKLLISLDSISFIYQLVGKCD